MDLRHYARSLFSRTMQSLDVAAAMRASVRNSGTQLRIGDCTLDSEAFDVVLLVALGKASAAMAHSALPLLEGLPLRGLVVSGEQLPDGDPRLLYVVGGHPIPNAGSRRAAEAALDLLASATERTLVLFLISGGASAMFELPLDASISLEETAAFYQILVHSGLPITEMNCVRKHFSAVKGGRLAQAAGAATQVTLVISDVPRNQLEVVASGPSLPDTSTIESCRTVLADSGLLAQFPPRIAALLTDPHLPETIKAGAPCLLHSQVVCLLSEDDLLLRARELAAADGFLVTTDTTCDDWPLEDAAEYLLERFRGLRKGAGKYCLISGGEISVPLPEHVGTGGRNQQFALACARRLSQSTEAITILSAGSDGLDGNSRAAGAVIDAQTWNEARTFGFEPEENLRLFNSFPVLDAIGATVILGPTGNNLRDIRILLEEI